MSELTTEGAIEAADALERATIEIKKVIVGQDRVVEKLIVGLVARGHLLLEGVPGLAKTLAMETMATVVGGTFARIQFTPDLLPADITGTRIYRASSEQFDVELGPIFVNFLLADEINRAPAKVQSALLEVMAEKQVSIAGVTHEVPLPFLVMATQNPIESEGVYPLPEAQRDRFLMKITIDYPSPAEEAEIVTRMGVSPPTAQQILTPEALLAAQATADLVHVDRGVLDYAVNLVAASRDPSAYGMPDLVEFIAYGASPRATLGLVRVGQGARAIAAKGACGSPGHLRRGARHLPAPPRPLLRGTGAGHHHRPRAGPDAVDRSGPEGDRSGPDGPGMGRVSAPPSVAGERPEVVLRRLELTVTRRLDGLLHGDYRGLVPGQGSEIGEAREYSPGDDVRRMDWNVTARTITPHIRETIADHELETWMLVDESASLSFGTASTTKRDLAVAAASAIGFLTSRTGNRIGALLLAGDRDRIVPARQGRSHLLALMRHVIGDAQADGTGATDLGAGISRLGGIIRRRGLAIIISDFLTTGRWEEPLKALGARQDVLAIEVVDPRELDLPRVGVLRVVDPETGQLREVQTNSRKVRRAYRDAAAGQRAQISSALRSAGADHLVLRTDGDWLTDLVKFVAQRRDRMDHRKRAQS